MGFAWSVSCSECRFEQTAGLDGFGIYYWLGAARFAPMPFVGVWCAGCGRVALAEEVPDEAMLVERGEWWLRKFRDGGCGPGDEYYDRKATEFAAQLEWRRGRVGPPRCLLCRSTAVTPLHLYGGTPSEFAHPKCGGRLQFDKGGWHYSTRAMWVYAPEGEFLGFGAGFDAFKPPPTPLSPADSELHCWVDIGRRNSANPAAEVLRNPGSD